MPVIWLELAGPALCLCWNTICEPDIWLLLLHWRGLYGSMAGELTAGDGGTKWLGVRGLRALGVAGVYGNTPGERRAADTGAETS